MSQILDLGYNPISARMFTTILNFMGHCTLSFIFQLPR